MNPLFVFLGILFVMAFALAWFAHKADLGDTLTEHAKLYVRAYVKGAALVTIAVLSAFDESFRSLTPEGADAMSWWQRASRYFKPCAPVLAGLAVLVAFLDRSIAKVQANPPPAEADKFAKLPAPPAP